MIAQDHRARLEFFCSKPNKIGYCRMTARWDGAELHCDEILPHQEKQRTAMADSVCRKLKDYLGNGSKVACDEYLAVFTYTGGETDDNADDVLWIGDRIVQAAKEAEAKSASNALWQPKIVMASEVTPRKREWLWPNRLVLGGLNLLAGNADLGKSLITLDIVSRVTRGAKWPDSDEEAPLGGAVILSQEDDLDTTVRPRLDAAGADCSRVALLQGVQFDDDDGPQERLVALDTDIAQVERAIGMVPDCRLVVIDPITAYMGSADAHKGAAVRGVMAKLADMAARCRVAVLNLSHLKKGEEKHAAHKVTGSTAFVDVSRTAWLATWHISEDQDGSPRPRRLLVLMKNNLTKQRSGLEYEITSKHSAHDEPHIEWSNRPIDLTANDVMQDAGKTSKGPKPHERDKAVVWLRGKLANGRRKAIELYAEAEGTIGKRSVQRALKVIGVEPYRDGGKGCWWWQLPHPNAGSEQETTGGVPWDEWSPNGQKVDDQVTDGQLTKGKLLGPLGVLVTDDQEDQVDQENLV
jgi:putative DNA primase/helicase